MLLWMIAWRTFAPVGVFLVSSSARLLVTHAQARGVHSAAGPLAGVVPCPRLFLQWSAYEFLAVVSRGRNTMPKKQPK